MKIRYHLLLGSLFLTACNAPSDSSSGTEVAQEIKSTTEPSAEEEWISLFDGTTTSGWHTYGNKPVGEAWQVKDGILYLDGTGKNGLQFANGGDLISDKEFEDFHLKLDWKVAENGNSGILFYVQEDTAAYEYPWQTGMEMQILHNEGHPDGKIRKHRAGDLYDLIEASEEMARPVGEWNQVEIISKDQKLDLILNGKNVVSTTLWDKSWQDLIAGSKFKDMPGFGTSRKGRIGIQDHGDQVWFRNIKIKHL